MSADASAAPATDPDAASPWGRIIFDALTAASVGHVTYVPDAGHARLINLCRAAKSMRTTVLTTEEEGIAVALGAWLGGERAALLMQSSGVGNCVNMLSLIASCRCPFLTVVTMRGEWEEFNPWQEPMGQATPRAFEIMGVQVLRVEKIEDLAATMAQAGTAFAAGKAVAVLLAQRLIGKKNWVEK